MTKKSISLLTSSALMLIGAGGAVFGEGLEKPSLNMYGNPGLIDMPSAESMPDGEVSVTTSRFAGTQRTTLSFQITPRLSGSFRYSVINDFNHSSLEYDGRRADRSFDIKFRLFDEGEYMPAIAVGLRDFVGTGIYSSEYIVATKHITPKFKITAGLGWGRLSDSGMNRVIDFGQGGNANFDSLFSGDVGAFGGIEWKTPIKNLTFKAEYSSDRYLLETSNVSPTRPTNPAFNRPPIFERKSDFNFGLEYTPTKNLHLGIYSLYGSEIGARLTVALNPKTQPRAGSYEPAPVPITPRPMSINMDTTWLSVPGIAATGHERLGTMLENDGIVIESLDLRARSVEVRFRNEKYISSAQAIGRLARVLAFNMPDSVETFILVPMKNGLPTSSVQLQRRDLEQLEHAFDGSRLSLQRAVISDAGRVSANSVKAPDLYPEFKWSISPTVGISLFDPADPVRADLSLRFTGEYHFTPGLSVFASVSKKLIGNLGGQSVEFSGVNSRPRSDSGQFAEEGDPAIDRLTLDYLFKLSPSIYGRFSAGYLEPMHGGVSAEVLWKPANKNWGFGAEVNYTKKRNFDKLFGFQTGPAVIPARGGGTKTVNPDYSILTGHVSAYWEMGSGFYSQLDVGRYLAGDYGATLSVDRRFDNGWEVGAYATLTDLPSADFGEGSFDKGIRMTIPLTWVMGTPTRRVSQIDLNSLSRDGGARVDINNRLYPMVRDYHRHDLEAGWGRFWR